MSAPTEIDGVPLFHGPHPDGEYAAGLVFRVGRADETLSTSGITHLVEHLALHGHGMSDLHYNGTTADLYTHFFVSGTREHVVEYLTGVCAGLRDLPLQRLETEKQILRTERGRGGSAQGLLYRYGARGHGLPAYAEMGLAAVGPDDVADWAARHFTRGNAALWLSGDAVPEGLRLDLPDGERLAVPDLGHELPQTPAWFGAGDDCVLADGLLPRGATAQVFAQVFGKALFRDLRQRDGISYRAHTDYQPRDRDVATLWAYADCPPEQRGALVGSFADCVARLRLAGPTEAEVEAAKVDVDRPMADEDAEARMVPGRAFEHLVGRPARTLDQLRADTAAVTVDDVREAAEQWHASSLVQVPALGLDWAGYVRAPEFTTDHVSGRTLPSAGPGGVELVLGPDGVSRLVEGEDWVTVRFDAVAALQTWPDGGRALIGRDGMRLPLEPTLTGLPEDVLREIDAAVPPGTVVPMPARDPQSVPQPQALPAPAPTGPPPLRPALKWVFVTLGGLAVLIALFLLLVLFQVLDDTGAAITTGLLIASFGGAGFLLIRRALR